jgi:hypothetical protein
MFASDPKRSAVRGAGASLLGTISQVLALAGEIAALASALGAPAIAPGGRDAAALITLTPGSYTVLAADAGTGTGGALVEVFAAP